MNVGDQDPIDFNDIGLKIGQQRQPCITRAEIVQSGLKPMSAIGGNNVLKMLTIGNLFILGEFERDQIQSKTELSGCGQGQTQTGFGMINRVGHEIDIQPTIQPQLGRCLDGLNSAGLIESVAVGLGHFG